MYSKTYGVWFKFVPLDEHPADGAQVATREGETGFMAPVWAGYLWPQDPRAGESHAIPWDVHLPALDARRREDWL